MSASDEVSFVKNNRLSAADILTQKRSDIERLARRLHDIFTEQCRGWRNIKINPFILREAVEHYFCDVYRLQLFRPVDNIDIHKEAAFIMKWVAKIKPVGIVSVSAEPEKSTVMVNAWFAIHAGFSLLQLGIKGVMNAGKLTPDYVVNLAYRLHLHPVDPISLASELFTLKMSLDSPADNAPAQE
ncbi:hypothetical protein AGMMS49959_03740 [Planctomycetales bacterium]|nr:hypothetical protein AGMMS49959_03740 [Planctomycetales bacterium]